MDKYESKYKDFFSKHLDLRFSNGLNVKLLPPAIIDKSSIQDIIDYTLYNSNRNKTQFEAYDNDDKDLINVFVGNKPVAIIDCYYPNIDMISKESLFLRYVALQQCNLKTFKSKTSRGIICYTEKNWRNALMLHMYHENLLGILKLDSNTFHAFQSILLGYSFEGLVYYLTYREFTINQNVEELSPHQRHKLYSDSPFHFYCNYYKIIQKRLDEIRKSYEKAQELIAQVLQRDDFR
jgi:hypothetical protein